MAAQGLRPEAPGTCHHHYCDGGSDGMNIFVFGSNLAGRHGAGAALTAKMFYGAKLGNGVGMSGESYAIPTKSYAIKTLPINIDVDWKGLDGITLRGDGIGFPGHAYTVAALGAIEHLGSKGSSGAVAAG